MEYALNNEDVLSFGNFNDSQMFFIQRWSELLNINTHSRYAVRYLNTHQALKEALYVCEGMINGEIKRTDHHLQLVFKEVNKIVVADQLFRQYAESHAKIMNNTLKSTPRSNDTSKIHSIIYQLEYVIRYLENNYLHWVVKELKELLREESDDNHFQKVELTIHMLASELLGNGWSQGALYSLVREEVLNNTILVEKRFDKLFRRILSEQKTHVYLYSIKSNLTDDTKEQLTNFKADLMDGKTVMDTYSDYNLGNNISQKKYYIRVIGESHDIQAGVNLMWQKIAEYMDTLRFYGFKLPNLDTAPIVLWPEGTKYTRNIHVSLVAKQRRFPAPNSIMGKIKKQLHIGNKEVNRKIKSLFEFARISDESLSPQSKFLNLWIGIESFVQTKENQGGIENVKMVVSSSATHNYLYSLLKNFIEDCNRCNFEIEIDGQIIRIGRTHPQDYIQFLINERYASEIERKCKELNNLLGYRYKELRETLTDGRKSSKILKAHKDNIEQHVQRLYRIRNAIVHSAELHYNTDLFIRHLNEYLESTMSVVLHRLEENPNVKLEEIFAQVRDSVEATIEILENSKHFDENAYYDLVLRGAF